MVINKSSFEDRLFFIDEIIQKKKTINTVATENGIRTGTLTDWLRRYRIHGEDALRPYKKRYHYTEETKISIEKNCILSLYLSSMNLKAIVSKVSVNWPMLVAVVIINGKTERSQKLNFAQRN